MSWVKENAVKRALKAGRPTAGAWLTLCSAISAEAMSRAGFDWLLIDMEHGHGDYQTLLAQLQAIEGSPAIPVVRVQWNDPVVIKRTLDLGAYGVIVPWIGSRADAESAVRACRYPPAGIRGMAGSHRAAGYGLHTAEYWRRANEEILVVLQIETAGAVEQIEGILRVPGVDAVFIGPADLAAALGRPGELSHPEVKGAIGVVEREAKAAGVALGTPAKTWDEARALYGRGYQLLTLCSDASLIVEGAGGLVARFREEIRP